MTHHCATPGVYIEEVTGPGAIAGVGTSTAAFVGPTQRGPLNTPQRITNWDEFLGRYGDYLFVGERPFYLPLAVRGFFNNGGQYAYIVRVGTGQQAAWTVENRAGEPVFLVRAQQEGAVGEQIQIEVQQFVTQAIATGSANVTGGSGSTALQVDQPDRFRVGDVVTDGTTEATINNIRGNTLHLSAPLTGATLRIADVSTSRTIVRMVGTSGLRADRPALLSNSSTVERTTIERIDTRTSAVTLRSAPASSFAANPGDTPSLTSIRVVALGSARVTNVNTTTDTGGTRRTRIEVDHPETFRPGDTIHRVGDTDPLGVVSMIHGRELIMGRKVTVAVDNSVRIADIRPGQSRFRIDDATGLLPGSVVRFVRNNTPAADDDYGVVLAVDRVGFVTLETLPTRTHTYDLGVATDQGPILISQEFRLIVTPASAIDGTMPNPESFAPLSLNSIHPSFLFSVGRIDSAWITIAEPEEPPVTAVYPNRLIAPAGPVNLTGGVDDQPGSLTPEHYQAGLDALQLIDDVNLVCIPDAASHVERQVIQRAMIDHCLALRDRFAILDSMPSLEPSGPGSIEEQRGQVEAESGFAALYYPWLVVSDPRNTRNASHMLVPPCGHIAGIYARTDVTRGVHKAPANEDVRGVLGLERRLNDPQQGPLNLAGINVLRLFRGKTAATVWGARTTVDPVITDWIYVNVRRLMLYIEESIEEGIRWAVFEPNNLSLWKKLKRTITNFLTDIWRAGALFGAKPEEAFYVRIDEGLNPPHSRALGRLYIEIGVAPVRPAEFIIVRIGLWDGGAEFIEA